MEFSFDINNLFGDAVTLVDKGLKPTINAHGSSETKRQLSEVIDKMGVASAKAQGLHGAITSASKLAYSDHRLYVLKDAAGNSGNGAVVGILKMGYKKLFVYDNEGRHHEVDPLCVLDFYVHESRQRMGCGKTLFEFMLQKENLKPQHLAIDRPSHKFQSFLERHYGLKATIPQVNNFVIFDGFFRNRSDQKAGRNGRNMKPNATLVEKQRDALSAVSVPARNSDSNSKLINLELDVGGRPPIRQAAGYSRHSDINSAPPSSNAPQAAASADVAVKNASTNQDYTPPMLRRDGPSSDFKQLQNGDFSNPSAYMDRRGHLRVAPEKNTSGTGQDQSSTSQQPSSTSQPPSTSLTQDRSAMPANFTPYANIHTPSNPYQTQPEPFTSKSAKYRQDTGFNVLGVPRNAPSYPAAQNGSSVNRKFQQTRLW